MNTSTIRLADEIFQRAADLPSVERAAYLVRACGSDATLREFVESLISEHDTSGLGLLDQPLIAGAAMDGAPHVPARIGPYEVLRILGEGGMAVVYEARQQNPSRTVALKVLRPGVVSSELLRRFQHEIQVLGQLQHPGIAHIYEAGIAPLAQGGGAHPQPYFVMELIRGHTLTAYASRHGLSDHDKMELVAKVCDAVQYAHQKGVIHRDLKPGNILVEDGDDPAASAEGGEATPEGHSPARTSPAIVQPKVLDFGVSRMADAPATMNTEAGRLIGTLAYMSPEQVSGDVNETDTRSDVYAIGVILYEMLTGTLPFSVSQCPLPEGVRRIREEEPTRLSVRDSRFRGDVEIIVGRAMARDKARRYQSAAELGEDLRRCLRGEAIEARRDSAVYVLRKSVRRYRGLVAAASTLVLGLAGFAAYAFNQARRFEALSQREHDARVSAESVKEFLASIFDLANPGPGKGYDLTLTDMLDEASRRLQEGALTDDQAVVAEVRDQLAKTYDNLELMDAAAGHRHWLMEYHKRERGENSREYVEAQFEYGRSMLEAGHTDESFGVVEAAFRGAVRVMGPKDPRTLDMQGTYANALMRKGRNEESLAVSLDTIRNMEEVLGPESLEVGGALFNIAGVYRNLKRPEEMRGAYERCLRIMNSLDEGSITTTRMRWYYASDCLAPRSLPEAEIHLRETIQIATFKRGADHPETLSALRALAVVIEKQGRRDEAIGILLNALSSIRGTKRWVLMMEPYIAMDAAWMLRRGKRFAEGATELRATRDRYEKFRDKLSRPALDMLDLEASLTIDQKQTAEAASLLERGAARLTEAGRDLARRDRWLKRAAQLRAGSG
jgi:serine/threonine protein kinase